MKSPEYLSLLPFDAIQNQHRVDIVPVKTLRAPKGIFRDRNQILYIHIQCEQNPGWAPIDCWIILEPLPDLDWPMVLGNQEWRKQLWQRNRIIFTSKLK